MKLLETNSEFLQSCARFTNTTNRNLSNESATGLEDTLTDSAKKAKSKHKCHHCQMSFTCRTYLLNHYKVCDEFMEIAKIIAKEICPALDCTKRFEKNSELMDHIRMCPLILKDIPTIPEISISNEESAETMNEANTHLLTGVSAKELCPAPDCGKEFKTKTELFKHFRECVQFFDFDSTTNTYNV